MSTGLPSPEELLAGPPPVFKFLQRGDKVAGEVIRMETTQRHEVLRNKTIGEPLFWKDGRPCLQVMLVLQDVKFKNGEKHRIFAKVPGRLFNALKDQGCTLHSFVAITYTDDVPNEDGFGTPAKDFQVTVLNRTVEDEAPADPQQQAFSHDDNEPF